MPRSEATMGPTMLLLLALIAIWPPHRRTRRVGRAHEAAAGARLVACPLPA